MRSSPASAATRIGAGLLGAGALALASAATAGAHVSVSPDEGAAGSYSVLTLSVPHGCDGSATTEVAIEIPEQILTVTPSVNPNWTVEKVMVDLDTPVTDSHGTEITERVGQVVYTATTPLPDGLRDTFELSVRLPETPGETLAFPTVQTCEQGEAAWVQVAAEDQSPDDLEMPAPLVTVTEPDSEEAPAEPAADETVEDDVAVAATQNDDGSGSGDGWGIAGLIAGLVGAALGAIALARTRRRA